MFHNSDRSGRWASKSKTCVPPFFSTKWETCKINIICMFECWQTPKPLQNEEPTVLAIYKMLPLQNQEPIIAYPCRHIGCPKKWFWRTPRRPIMERNLLRVWNCWIYMGLLPPNTFNQLQFKLLLHSLGWVPLELLCKAVRTTERKWEALGRRLKVRYALRGWWRKPSWRFHCTSSTFSGKFLVGYTFCHPWVFFEGLESIF